jgi:hypothetical protein
MTVYTIFAEGDRELAKVASLEEAAIQMLTIVSKYARSKIFIGSSSRTDQRMRIKGLAA